MCAASFFLLPLVGRSEGRVRGPILPHRELPLSSTGNTPGRRNRARHKVLLACVSILTKGAMPKAQVRKEYHLALPFPRPSTGPPSPNSPKLLRRLPGKLPGKLGVLGGVVGELLRRLPKSAVSLLFRGRGSLRSSSPGTPPSTPSFPGNFPGSLRSSFGEFLLGGPIDGRGNGKCSQKRWHTHKNFHGPIISKYHRGQHDYITQRYYF